MIRDIVTIDEDLCTGCGECVSACAEGAIRIVDGKAKLVSDTLCDGLGACLGHCPQGAIKIERREATPFDEAAVRGHGALSPAARGHATAEPPRTGCPSGQFAAFDRRAAESTAERASGTEPSESAATSALTHWPVQLRLLPARAPVFHGARLLVAADCVPVALADFHSRLLRGHAVVIACPKLDDPSGYVEKLADMIRHNDLAAITVARMEVPCCAGILRMVLEARRLAERDVPVDELIVSIRGDILTRRAIPAESGVLGNGHPACCPSTGVH